jgi:putative transposase
MPFDPSIHHRKSIRLRGYDYTQPGAYFVTVVVKNRDCLFGEIAAGVVNPNNNGRIIQSVWRELPIRFSNVILDESIVMPDHFHGIIIISEITDPQYPTLGQIVAFFKYQTTKSINQFRAAPRFPRLATQLLGTHYSKRK